MSGERKGSSVDPAVTRRLRAIATKSDELDRERVELILRAHREGASLREIAAAASMSHVGVKKLIDRQGQ